MSTVLIGIIGVVLFIGLALAGALILGSDFSTASSASQAAAIMSQLKQSSDAAGMWRLKTGQTLITQEDTSFLVPRFLKSRAANMSKDALGQTSFAWQVYFNDNVYPETFADAAQTARFVTAVVGPQTDASALSVCQSIADTYSTPLRTLSGPSDNPTDQAGCALSAGQYIAYATL